MSMEKLKIDAAAVSILDKDTELIKNDTIRQWANNYLHGHIDHYNGVLVQLTKALELSNSGAHRILEVGSVPGQLTTFLASKGFDIEVVDIEPERISEVFKKYDVDAHKVDIEREKLPLEDNSYDIVMFNEVFEHLHINPLRILDEIYRVLKKGGILLMSVPNINPLMRWEFLFGKDYNDNLKAEFAKIDSIGHMGHFRLYSKSEIDSLLIQFNFVIEDYAYAGRVYNKPSKWLGVFKILFKNKMRNQYHVLVRKE
jgi:SAM-dependent methyltransferase